MTGGNLFRHHLYRISFLSIAPPTATFFFPTYSPTTVVLRAGWHNFLLESSCIRMISTRHIARLGKLVSSSVASHPSFGHGHTCSGLTIQAKTILIAASTGPECQSCMFPSRSSFIEDAPTPELQTCLCRSICLPTSSIALEYSNTRYSHR